MVEYRNPLPAVDAVAIYEDKLVLVERSDGRGLALPGGFWNFGETPEEAVARELKEETNLEFHILGQLPVRGHLDRDPRTHVLSVPFYGIATGSIRSGDDASDVHLVNVNEALELKLAFDHKDILESYLEKIK